MSTQPKATVAKRGNNNFAGSGDGGNLGLRKIHKSRLTQETALKKKEILPYKNKYDCIPTLTCRIRIGQLGIKNFAQQCIYMSETEECMWVGFQKNFKHKPCVTCCQGPEKLTTKLLSFQEGINWGRTGIAGPGEASFMARGICSRRAWSLFRIEIELPDLQNWDSQDCSLRSCICKKHLDGWFWWRETLEDPFSEVYSFSAVLYDFRHSLAMKTWCEKPINRWNSLSSFFTRLDRSLCTESRETFSEQNFLKPPRE